MKRNIFEKLFIGLVTLTASSLAHSNYVEELHQLECTECSSFFSKPTTTFAEFSASPYPKNIIVYIGGGDTNVGWALGRGLFVPTYPTTAGVYDLTSYGTAVFMLDFPGNLGNMYERGEFSAAGRGTTNHHRQVTQAIKFARKKYPNKPVYLVGHSNGTVSINRTMDYLADTDQLSLVKGIALSAPIQEEIGNFNSHNVRALVTIHTKDKCKGRTATYDKDRVIEDLSEETSDVKGALFQGGTNYGAGRKGCDGGYHSYEGAEGQFTDALFNWMNE